MGRREPAPNGPADAPPPRRRWRRWRLVVGLLVAGILLLVLGAPLLAPLAVRAGLEAARRAGLPVRAEAVEARSWSDVELVGVHLGPLDGLPRLAVSRLRVRASVWGLLRSGLDGLRAVEADGLDVVVDLDVPATDDGPTLAELTGRLPRLAVRRGRITLDSADTRHELAGLELEAAPAGAPDGGLVLRLAADALTLDAGAEPPLWRGPVQLDGRLQGSRLLVTEAALDSLGRWGPGPVELGALPDVTLDLPGEVAAGTLALRGSVIGGELDVALLGRSLDLAALARAAARLGAPPLTLAGRLDVEGRVAGPLDRPGALATQLEVALADLAVEGERIPSVTGTLDLGDDALSLAELRLVDGANALDVEELTWRLDDPTLAGTAGRLALRAGDPAALLERLGLAEPWPLPPEPFLELAVAWDGGAVRLLGGRARWTGGSAELLDGRLVLPDPRRPRLADADLALDIALDVPDLSSLAALPDGPALAGALAGTVTLERANGILAGRADLAGAELVLDGLPLGDLALAARGDGTTLEVARAELTGDGHRLELAGTVDVATGRLAGTRGMLEVADLATLLPGRAVTGTLAATLTVEGPPDDPRGHLRLAATALRTGSVALDSLDAELHRLDGPLEIASLRARRGDLTGTARGRIVSPAGGSLDEPPLELVLDELALEADGPRLALVRPATVRWADGRLAVDEAVLEGRLQAQDPAAGTLRVTGGLVGLGDPAAGWPAVLTDAHLELDVASQADALAVWRPFLPLVRRLDGRLEATLALRGPLAAPVVSGEATLADGEVKLAADVPAFGGVTGRLRLDGDELHLEHLRGAMGSAPFELDGTLTFPSRESWPEALAHPAIDLRLHGQELLLARGGGVRLRADADLRWTGTLTEPRLGGTLQLVDGRIVRRVPLLSQLRPGETAVLEEPGPLFSFVEPPLRDLQLDVRITTTEPVVVANNLVRGRLHADAVLQGTGQVPLLVGSLFLQEARVRLPAGTLRIPSGTLRFLREDPFRPTVELAGSTRLRGYDVEVVLRGPLDEPELLLTSSPPLPRDELLLLFVAGQPPASGTRQGMETLAVYLARDALTAFFDDESTEVGEGIVDRIDIVVGEDVTRSGAETLSVSYRLTREADDGAPGVYLTSEQDQRSDVNFGLRFVFRLR